jgi:hypothetical protein
MQRSNAKVAFFTSAREDVGIENGANHPVHRRCASLQRRACGYLIDGALSYNRELLQLGDQHVTSFRDMQTTGGLVCD